MTGPRRRRRCAAASLTDRRRLQGRRRRPCQSRVARRYAVGRPLAPGTALDVVVHRQPERGGQSSHRPSGPLEQRGLELAGACGARISRSSVHMTRSGLTDDSPGVYQQRAVGSFLVAARHQDFRVDATLEADTPVMGSTLHGVVDAKYLFGSPLQSRPVRWWAHRTPTVSVPDAVGRRFREAQYAFGYRPDADQLPPEPRPGCSRRRRRSMPTAGSVLVCRRPQSATSRTAYMFEGDVEDVAGQHIANRAGLVVHPAALYVGLTRPKMFVDTAVGAKVGVVAVDLAGQPVVERGCHAAVVPRGWVRQPAPNRGGRSGLSWQRKEIPAGEWRRAKPRPADTPVAFSRSKKAAATSCGQPHATRRADAHGCALLRPRRRRIVVARATAIASRSCRSAGRGSRVRRRGFWCSRRGSSATALVTKEREGIRTHSRVDIRPRRMRSTCRSPTLMCRTCMSLWCS